MYIVYITFIPHQRLRFLPRVTAAQGDHSPPPPRPSNRWLKIAAFRYTSIYMGRLFALTWRGYILQRPNDATLHLAVADVLGWPTGTSPAICLAAARTISIKFPLTVAWLCCMDMKRIVKPFSYLGYLWLPATPEAGRGGWVPRMLDGGLMDNRHSMNRPVINIWSIHMCSTSSVPNCWCDGLCYGGP